MGREPLMKFPESECLGLISFGIFALRGCMTACLTGRQRSDVARFRDQVSNPWPFYYLFAIGTVFIKDMIPIPSASSRLVETPRL